MVGITGVAFGIISLWALINCMRRVDEGELAVILRLGQYAGVRGPGLVWVIPAMERIARYLPVALRTQRFIVEPVFAQPRLPLRLDFTVWYRLDPRLAGDDEADVALRFDEAQWHQAIRGELGEVVRRIAGEYKGMDLLGDNKCRGRAEADMMHELRDKLRRRGVLLDQERGAVLSAVDVEQRLKDALVDVTRVEIDTGTKKRLWDTILQEYPGLSPDIIPQLVASITGIDLQDVLVRMPPLTEVSAASTTSPDAGLKSTEEALRRQREAWRRGIREVKDIDFDVKAV